MSKKDLPRLVVESSVKELISGMELRTAGDFAEALNAKVAEIIEQAAARCKGNDRQTVRAADL
jgi:histone H3/H4